MLKRIDQGPPVERREGKLFPELLSDKVAPGSSDY